MKPLNEFAVLIVTALLIAGCVGPVNNSGGMESPQVCRVYCSPGQTQAPYPDCSCSGGGIEPMPTAGGYGWTPVPGGGTGGTGGTTGTPGGLVNWTRPDAGLTGAGWGTTAEDVMRAGTAAQVGEGEGMIVIMLGTKNANETPFSSINLTTGAVSTYHPGAGGGWSTLSTGTKDFELKGLAGRQILISQGRTGEGVHTRFLIEFRNLTVSYNGSTAVVGVPKTYLVIVGGVPVTHSATSAVRLTLDLNRSISRDPVGGWFIFTPVFQIDSLHMVRYSVMDDGTIDFRAGTLDLSEIAIFNATGASSYSVLGGALSDCVSSCASHCSNIASATCHNTCVSQCFGVVDIVPDSCDDGTAYNSCSTHKPLYCVTGTYILRCSSCGCPQDQECLSDGTCRLAPVATGGAACSFEGCVSGSPPMACRGGQFTQDCVACGCPDGKNCRAEDGVCVPSAATPVPTPEP